MNNAANNQREGFRKPSYANNKKFQGKKSSNFKPRKKVESETSIKKKMGLKEIPMLDYKEKRMYRLSIIFGSTVIADIFVVNVPFVNSMVTFRDKLLKSYMDLLKLLNKDVVDTMLPKVNLRNVPEDNEEIAASGDRDIINSMVLRMYKPILKADGEIYFNSIVRYVVNPGTKVNGVINRVVITINHVNNPNFSPKKAGEDKKEKKPLMVKKFANKKELKQNFGKKPMKPRTPRK